jgi:2-oxoglutarate ferredoxin oxidoreductase subunit gamma
MRYEIRLSGAGGQGMILAGVILAEAAAIYDEKNATQSQSYGPEARGGASKSEVIISDEDIDYPKATNIDLLLALTQEAYDKYVVDLKENAILIVDSFRVTTCPDGKFKLFKLPILKTAEEKVGKVIVANIVALGAIVAISDIVTKSSIESAVLARVPRGTEELNRRALQAGMKIANKAKSEMKKKAV